jgi:hypothetical protein
VDFVMDKARWTFRAVAEHLLIYARVNVWEAILEDESFAYELKTYSTGDRDPLLLLYSLLPERMEVYKSIYSGAIKIAHANLTSLCGPNIWIHNQSLDFSFKLQNFVELSTSNETYKSLEFARGMDFSDESQRKEAMACFFAVHAGSCNGEEGCLLVHRRHKLAEEADAALLNYKVGTDIISHMKSRLPSLKSIDLDSNKKHNM